MGSETSKCYHLRTSRGDFARFLNGRGIDIGCGTDPIKVPHGTVDPWDLPQGDAQNLEGVKEETYDFVYSSHCLEHLTSVEGALQNWGRVLKAGGILYLVIPDYELYEKCQFPSNFNADHKHTFSLKLDRQAIRRKNHWHVLKDLSPILARQGIRILNTYLEHDGYDFNLPESIDQTGPRGALAQICIIGIKEGFDAPYAVKSSCMAPEITPGLVAHLVETANGGEKHPVVLVIEGGIGDVLSSFSALPWLKDAYPGRSFLLFVMEHSPGRAEGMRSVAETHPDIAGVKVVKDLAELRAFLGPEAPQPLNISPWHFLTSYFRNHSPHLHYYLTHEDRKIARQIIGDFKDRPLVFQPVASNPKVNWPTEHWRDLAATMAKYHPVLVVGAPNSPPIHEATLDLQGKLSVRQSMALTLEAAGVVAARSFLSIVSMDAGIPTMVLSPATRLHEIRDYAYPSNYFSNGSVLLDTSATPTRASELFEPCLKRALGDLTPKEVNQ